MLKHWFDYLLGLVRVPILRRIWLAVLILGLYSAGVVALEDDILNKKSLGMRPELHAVLGLFLAMLLSFRNNTAYDRWWEGRKLWGQLVNDSRNLIIKVRCLQKLEHSEIQQLGRMLVNFARALQEHLREGIRANQLTLYRGAPVQPTHVPLHIAWMVRERIVQWRANNKIDGFEELQLDQHARALMDICGACERIRKTGMSHSYLAYTRQIIALYMYSLPWGLVESFDWLTVPAVMIAGYFMIGLELIAEEVGEPFGRGMDDLRLEDICRTIEDSVKEVVSRSAEINH
jgi:putative membrane protein